ncbi:DUF1492 domain-containing protein [Anaerosinus massiliensis]|uniref:DUF1492 domain-containing protein n=1 Tax=Massilibacillus massiliensis TaxID=1806837 RepID=UPI000DA60FA2|nr:DUF1492 domain-containing protein [Massilibacillus massiliensis]
MGLTKKDHEEIENLFNKAVSFGRRQSTERDTYRRTERSLRAYPILKENIKRYELDIKDIAKEDMRTSKDFVLYLANSGGSEKMDIEDIREAKILAIRQKIVRDQKKIEEINIALNTIKSDEYYQVIEMIYFEGLKEEEIVEQMHCDRTTVYRNRKRLINTISVSLWGADAVQ